MPGAEVLVAHSDVKSRYELTDILRSCNLRIAIAESVTEAAGVMFERAMHLGFCEESLPEGGFCELLRQCTSKKLQVPLVVCGAPERYLPAMWTGAFDYVSPPYSLATIEHILKRRREPRTELKLPVQIYGVDVNGIPFSQSVWTRNISHKGARLEGISCELQRGAVVGLRCHDRQANFRVVWTARSQEDHAFEIGVEDIDLETGIWNLSPELQRKRE